MKRGFVVVYKSKDPTSVQIIIPELIECGVDKCLYMDRHKTAIQLINGWFAKYGDDILNYGYPYNIYTATVQYPQDSVDFIHIYELTMTDDVRELLERIS